MTTPPWPPPGPQPWAPPGPAAAGPPPGPAQGPPPGVPYGPSGSPWPQSGAPYGSPSPAPPRWSPRRKWAVGVAVAVLCLGLLAGLTFGAVQLGRSFAGGFACDERDEALAKRLSELPELSLRPPSAQPQDEVYRECSFLDGYAWAEQEFESTAGPADVLAFYRKELPAAGWAPVPTPAEEEEYGPVRPEGITCFSRQVDGATAYLLLYFPEEDGRNTTMYWLEVSATHADPDLGC